MKTANKLLVILGPTASGKSDLAVEIALRLSSGQARKQYQINGAEIISADSRQVYKDMDIGTGKVPRDPSRQSLIASRYFYRGIQHHLLDVADPKRRFTVAQYKRLAQKAIKDVQRRGKLAIICGGTGFYIQAITDNLQIPEVKPDLKLRARLEKMSVQDLFIKLKRMDPVRAAKIDRYNPRRLIRALEIVLKSGKPVPQLNPPQPSPVSGTGQALKRGNCSPPLGGVREDFSVLFLGIQKPSAELKKLIHKRLLKRLRQGMIAEVKNLRQSGLSWKRLDSFGLEYRWIAKYLKGKTLRRAPQNTGLAQGISYNEMFSRLQKESEHYAKRQMVWFKKYPGKKVRWITNKNQTGRLVKNFLK